MQDFRNLRAWQTSRRLANAVYDATEKYPPTEIYGLRGQMRRACVSICANLAEGCGRATDRDFRRFVAVAMGSACELECETILSLDRSLISELAHRDILGSVDDVKRMLSGLLATLSNARRPVRDDSPEPPIADDRRR